MYFLNLCDFIVQFNNDYRYMCSLSKKYQVEQPTRVDLEVTVPEEHVVRKEGQERIPLGMIEALEFQRTVSDWLPLHNAFLLHCVCIDVDGTGVAFAAHSGTGKSTHMMLWQQLLGEKMTVVNGDKPFIRFFDEEPKTPYAYGTPWNGKERLGCNMRTPLKHICFITRSEQNSTVKITKAEAITRIMNQVYMPKDPAATAATLQLINRLLDSVQLWEICCNMELDAAKTAYNAIFGASNKN